MAELNFNASNPTQLDAQQPQRETPLSFFTATTPQEPAPQPDVEYIDPHQQYKLEYDAYLTACHTRKQVIAEATADWRKAIQAVQEAQIEVARRKAIIADLKANPAPRAPIKYV